MNSKKIVVGAAVSIAMFVNMVATAFAANTTVVVTPNNLDNTSTNPALVATDGLNKWFLYNDTNDTVDNTLGSFVTGVATPPHGVGSVQFTLGASPLDRKNIATFQFSGKALASITQIGFSAYSHSGVSGPTESPFLNFNVDFTGTSGAFQGRLVYVPSANGAVPQDAWNTYDAINGGNAQWTWSHYGSNGNKWPDNNTNQYRTWNDITTTFPNARLLPVGGWLGIRVGEPGPMNYTANVDSFTLGTASGTTVFDFEPNVGPPTNQSQCKHDGWKTFNNPSFKNEERCRDYVEDHRVKPGKAEGDIHLSNPRQRIDFEVKDASNHDKGEIAYWNYDYPGGLHYETHALCVNVNKTTKESRFMFQIPSGHPGLSGLYVVSYVKDTGTPVTGDLYGHAATGDLSTAQSWCQTGIGFTPTMYVITSGHLEVH